MKYYTILYWKGSHGESTGSFHEVICIVTEETLEKLLSSEPPAFIKVIIKDGEESIITTDQIFEITETYIN